MQRQPLLKICFDEGNWPRFAVDAVAAGLKQNNEQFWQSFLILCSMVKYVVYRRCEGRYFIASSSNLCSNKESSPLVFRK
jgi:hypothetical protein